MDLTCNLIFQIMIDNQIKNISQDYEMDALNNLKKILVSKWDFVTMQAEEQVRQFNTLLLIHFYAAESCKGPKKGRQDRQ